MIQRWGSPQVCAGAPDPLPATENQVPGIRKRPARGPAADQGVRPTNVASDLEDGQLAQGRFGLIDSLPIGLAQQAGIDPAMLQSLHVAGFVS